MMTLTRKQVEQGAGYASQDFREEILERMKSDDEIVINFSYTDYGGDFLDKVFSKYFQENHPDHTLTELAMYHGENTYVFMPIAKDFNDATKDYPLGYEDTEEYYSEKEMEEFEKFIHEMNTDYLILDDYDFDPEKVTQWLRENKYGYYNITTEGVDVDLTGLFEEMETTGIIKKKIS